MASRFGWNIWKQKGAHVGCVQKWAKTWSLHFLGLLQLSTTVWVTSNNRSLCPQSSGGQKSKIKALAGPCFSRACRRESFLASSSSWWLQMFLGLWQHLSGFCLCLSTAVFSVCWSVFKFSSSYKVADHLALGSILILTLTWLHLQRPHFQIKSHSQVLGLGLQHVSWESIINPYLMGLWKSKVAIHMIYWI